MSQNVRKRFWVNDTEAVFVIFLLLILVGTINVFSSSFVLGETNFGSPYFFLKRQILNLFVGGICFFIGAGVNYHHWRKHIVFIVSLTFAALAAVLVIGTEVNGAKRWLGISFLQIQPAEIAKLVALMLIAAYAASRAKADKTIGILNPQTFIIFAMGALIELEPDAGTMAIVILIPFLLLCVAGLSRRKVLGMMGFFVTAAIGLILLQPYRLQRIKVLYDPWSDAQGIGYQTVQSLSAIGSGGLSGMGLGLGVSKYSYLPEAHTDFAFAILSQELGFLGVVFVILLYVAFAVYAVRIANAARDAFGQFLAAGVLLLIVGQAIINIAMVGGLLPVIGVPLPFISYGGTSLMVSMASVGILVNIGRHGAKHEKERQWASVAVKAPPKLRLIRGKKI